ncbi:MAG: RloB domain-containing protein [Gammaproteobacteria bacterium]|nr:RloB domain-containing protein [Gammaproteobacteria bacterium]
MEVCNAAARENVCLAISNPCFEFWYVLHEVYTTAQFRDCDAVIARLRQYREGYAKNCPVPEDLLEKLPAAYRNAHRCDQYHTACNGDGNPSTCMYLLAKALNDVARPNFRFVLAMEGERGQGLQIFGGSWKKRRRSRS